MLNFALLVNRRNSYQGQMFSENAHVAPTANISMCHNCIYLAKKCSIVSRAYE